MLTQAVEAKQATGPQSQLVVSGAMTILHQYVLKCVPLQSVAMFDKCETTRCGESPRIFAWSCQFTLQKYIFYILKSVCRVLTTLCTLVIMMKKMDGPPKQPLLRL
jgi:hypothetical protein